ncbi:hypothetical protein [Hymenobacter swuensis]|uniref:Uncharacterized protein n=1 Tax=Hymenobacter swuensis DY53 TaxID=1227739 RepID=W8EXX5_9BACT|nr:hypothetical protein [Hymenobacter swuensis]AHJ97408.1 hypothetical protein Hsw_1813 [Hymenobacter swuensis DY53]
MGKELRLSGQNFNPEAALQFVQRRFYVARHNTSERLDLFAKQPDSVSLNETIAWPPAFVTVENDGFYFCDNLLPDADSALIFKALCEFMLTTNEKILVTEL